MVVPIVTQAVCFRPRVLAVGVALSAFLATPAVLLAPEIGPAPTAPPVVHLVAYLALLASLALAAHHLASAERHSRDEAVVDPMTGLLNRLSLSARFEEAVRSAALEAAPVGLVMCDVDHFKRINDSHGHDRGDQVLVELARRLRGTLRSTDLAYRVGGEEFVLLLPGRDAASAERVAERIRRTVAATPLAGLSVTVSAGVVSAPAGAATLSSLLRDADAALYSAKRAGRDRVVLAG